MEWPTIVKDFVLPAIAAIGAAVVVAIRVTYKLTQIESAFNTLKLQFENTQKAWKLDLDAFEAEVEGRMKDLRQEGKETDGRLSRFRESSTDFAKEAELARFIVEQERQWKEIQRTLGQIEGALKAGK